MEKKSKKEKLRIMKSYKLSFLTDSIGQSYIGFNIPKEHVQPYIDELRYILKDDLELYQDNKFKRDGFDKYHITVINSMNYIQLSKYNLSFITWLYSNLEETEFPIDFKGIGKASKNEDTTYFVVCQGDEINGVRTYFGLEPIDLHITLGFDKKDVFGVDKNQVIDINKPSAFIEKVSQYSNPFQILKSCKNLTNPSSYKILEIKETHLVIENNTYKGTISLDGENFFLSSHYNKKQ